MKSRDQQINYDDDTDDVFFKKLKNRNKSQMIIIDNKEIEILGFRKKYWKTEYDEGDYLEICPVEKMATIPNEFIISIKEKWYERKYICTQFRNWTNYNSFWIKKEWTYILINLSCVVNLESFHACYSQSLNLPDCYGKNLDSFYDSTWGISFIPDEIEFINTNFFKNQNEVEYKKLMKVISKINLENNIKMTITKNVNDDHAG